MASIHKEILINAKPEDVWSAVRDFGAVHKRLAPGLVVDTRLDGETRTVSFSNGVVVQERLIDIDDDVRRVAYSVVKGSPTHHNASMQVFTAGEGRSRFVWIADLLPDELAASISSMMDQGSSVIKQTLESNMNSV
jgi:carbon monoxide dehydrogenase subunit G